MRTISVCGSACGKPSFRIWLALCDWPVVASSISRFFVPTTMPMANAATTNASQPKTAVFQWLALQRPIRAAMLFERLSGDMSGCSFAWLCVYGICRSAHAGEEVDAVVRRVGVGVVERVHGLVRRDLDVEVVSALGVEDGDRETVRLRIPEQCDLETVAGSNVQLTCQLARHLCLLSPVASRSQRPIARLWRKCGLQASFRAAIRTQEGRRPPGSGGLRREEEVGGLGGLGKVRVDQRVRQLPLHANDRDAVPLELVRGRSVLAERLALQYELTKLSVQLVDVHAWSFAPIAARGQGAGWRPVVRFSLGMQVGEDRQDAPVILRGRGQPQLAEDARHVLLHRAQR